MLLANGAVVNHVNDDNETALHLAVTSMALESSIILLKHGIDVNVANKVYIYKLRFSKIFFFMIPYFASFFFPDGKDGVAYRMSPEEF